MDESPLFLLEEYWLFKGDGKLTMGQIIIFCNKSMQNTKSGGSDPLSRWYIAAENLSENKKLQVKHEQAWKRKKIKWSEGFMFLGTAGGIVRP